MAKGKFFNYAAPILGFVMFGWFGLNSLIQSRNDLKALTMGLEQYEELDPVEKMRQRYNLGDESYVAPRTTSIEEEWSDLEKKLDIKNFDYVPVQRDEDDMGH